jgi:hypothetical protein
MKILVAGGDLVIPVGALSRVGYDRLDCARMAGTGPAMTAEGSVGRPWHQGNRQGRMRAGLLCGFQEGEYFPSDFDGFVKFG